MLHPHLAAGGRLVIELGVPNLQRFPPGALAVPFDVSPSHLCFDVFDVATQQGVSHHYLIAGDRVARFDSPWRYVWPRTRSHGSDRRIAFAGALG